MTAIAPITCSRCPPNTTTGSRERGENLSTRYSGIFAAECSTGSSRSLSGFAIQHPKGTLIISLCVNSGEPSRGDGLQYNDIDFRVLRYVSLDRLGGKRRNEIIRCAALNHDALPRSGLETDEVLLGLGCCAA